MLKALNQYGVECDAHLDRCSYPPGNHAAVNRPQPSEQAALQYLAANGWQIDGDRTTCPRCVKKLAGVGRRRGFWGW